MVLKEKNLGDSGPKAFSQPVRIREHAGPGTPPLRRLWPWFWTFTEACSWMLFFWDPDNHNDRIF